MRDKVAARVKASPSATLGPVVEKSLNLVVPINDNPTITVPAVVRSAREELPRVLRIARAGSTGSQFSANRHERNRQKSVPLPNRTATRRY